MSLRIGVASIMQETNTFVLSTSTLADFEAQGIYRGSEADRQLTGTNTEFAGAVEAIRHSGAIPVPLLRAWAMSGGRLTRTALETLGDYFATEMRRAGRLDGLVLSLHGALASETEDSADTWLLHVAREYLGDLPIGVTLDLHANVTEAIVAASDFVIGYHTHPHVDQARTGGRAADLLIRQLHGEFGAKTVLSKRSMLLPAETTQTTSGPMSELRAQADQATVSPILDVSFFPVQPWLDVPELGFGVTVTAHDTAGSEAAAVAEEIAERAWSMREQLSVQLVDPRTALELARTRTTGLPLLVSESADSPTAGTPGDSPAMIRALLRWGKGLKAYATVVDPAAVEACFSAGVGSSLTVSVGASIDPRFHAPVEIEGTVDYVGSGQVRLTGSAFTGMEVSMGRCAVLRHGTLSVLLSERPALSFDPATFESVGLSTNGADVIVVRSANIFRAGYGAMADDAVILDVSGASTPRLETLTFERAPRPLYPLDQ